MTNSVTHLIDGKLAIPGGHSSKHFSLSKIIEKNNRTGYLVTKDTVEEYTLEGIRQVGDSLFIIGPGFQDAISAASGNPGDIRLTLGAMQVLQEQGITIPSIDLRYVMLKGDSVLFLPFELVKSLVRTQNVTEELEEYHFSHNPDLADEKGVLFTLCAHLYKYFAKTNPFIGHNLEDLREHIRNKECTPLEYVAPEVRPELSQLITQVLIQKSGTIEDLKLILDQSEFIINLSEEDKKTAEDKKKEYKRKLERKQKNRKLLRTYGLAAAIIFSAVVLAGFVITPIISKIVEPPITAGLTPLQLVKGYYYKFNKLDFQFLEDVSNNGAADRRYNISLNVYANNKIRQGYHMSQYLTASDWDYNGRPEFVVNQVLFGITSLEVEQLDEDSFKATYEEYFPESVEESQVRRSRGYLIEEILDLEEVDGIWYITSINQVSKTDMNYFIELRSEIE